MNTITTIKSACHFFKHELHELYIDSELNQMLYISFFYLFGWSRTDVILHKEEVVSEKQMDRLMELVAQLKTSKPLAQIIGVWEFYGLQFKVNKYTLIPRPETEELVQLIVQENKTIKQGNILDVGTGTGCIAIALKKELKMASIDAFDVSDETLKIATENAQNHSLNVSFNKVDIIKWKDYDFIKKYDIIVSNPPYIPTSEKNLMHKNVLDFEPHLALFVENNDPLIFYDTIAEFALKNLKPNGKLYFEINENYGQATKQLLIDKKYRKVDVLDDINEKNRMIRAIL